MASGRAPAFWDTCVTGADTATPNYFSVSLTFSNILVFSPFYNWIDHKDTARLRGKDPVNTSTTPEPIFTPSVLFSGHRTDCSCGQWTPIHLNWPVPRGWRLLSLVQGGANAHEKQKLYYDGTVRHQPYAVGDLVWLHNPTEDHMKLAPHWRGPYRVLSVLGSQGEPGLTYHIGSPLDFDGQGQVVHYDRLKPYTLPMAAGFSDSLPASPLYAPSLLDEGSPEGHLWLRNRWPLVTQELFGLQAPVSHYRLFLVLGGL
ncbi:uncharacterized protein LOC126401206 [Epinephelus moara]|uniref:uncharacterized protein LOC126401206 n=1 Tax=Epinephelus moara TaxID=300413 RepID=UPI00214F5928|nr:uncharacterized protein LOC126401206 [Epinephelus moara]